MSSTHWKVHSAWSKAGIGTNIVLELKPPQSTNSASKSSTDTSNKKLPRIALDMGSTPVFDAAIPAKYVLLSHGHVDHVGAVFSHARAHSVSCGGEVPTYYAPAELIPQLEQCRDAMMALDSSTLHTASKRRESLISSNFVAVRPGEEFLLKGIHSGSKTSFFIRAFRVDHCGHPALGYLIGSRTTTGIKDEYKSLDKSALREIVKSGIMLQADPIETIEVAYTGDTCVNGLIIDGFAAIDTSTLYKQQLFHAEVILCELTFLDVSENEERKRKAAERGHLHICDLERLFTADKIAEEKKSDGTFDSISKNISERNTQQIIFYHLSGRNSPATRALDMITEGLPHQLRSRCQVAISSLVSTKERSSLGRVIQPNGCMSLAAYLAWKDRPT